MPTVEELRKNNDEYQKEYQKRRSEEKELQEQERDAKFSKEFLRKINIVYSKLSDLSKSGSTGAVIMKENDHQICNLMKKKVEKMKSKYNVPLVYDEETTYVYASGRPYFTPAHERIECSCAFWWAKHMEYKHSKFSKTFFEKNN